MARCRTLVLWLLVILVDVVLLPLLCSAGGRLGGRRSHFSDRRREKRSNFRCGDASWPCNRSPTGFGGRQPDGFSNSNDAGQNPSLFVRAPNIRPQMVLIATREALEDMNRLFNVTEPFLSRNRRPETKAATFWSAYTSSHSYAKDLSYSALVSVDASKRLRSFGLRTQESVFGLPKLSIANTVLEDICPPNLIRECVPGRFRTYGGYCNNVNNALWGSVFEPMQRYLSPDYADFVSSPRAGRNGRPLANARVISAAVLTAPVERENRCSMALTYWAQFVFDDIVHISSAKGAQLSPLPCCSPNIQHPECLPISITGSDPTFRGFVSCLPYARSAAAPRERCALGPREQSNSVSSFLDGSQIYGSTMEQAKELRSFSDGKLRMRQIPFLKDLLPPKPFDRDSCASSASRPCFRSGSDNANFAPPLTALHTIFAREHNRIADKLKKLNPVWDDEQLYQESRKIVGAELQHITYFEFLPLIVGMENMQKFGLLSHTNGYSSDYNIGVNPSVMNSYAAAVGNFFFALIPDTVRQYSPSGQVLDDTPLSRLFLNPGKIYFQNSLEGYLRYLLREPIHKFGPHMSDQLHSRLFRGNEQFGLDMASMLIQRGRDHGIPSYSVWRTQCGLRRPTDFDALQDDLNPQALAAIRNLYNHVDDVDLFVGGLAENSLRGSLVGPTFACILSKQFQKTKRGDRLWYENFFFPSAFTEDQLNELRKATLTRVICENTDDIGVVQPCAFSLADKFENCPIPCNSSVIEQIDYTKWKDSEAKVKLPITQSTIKKATLLGEQRVRERRRLEGQRIRLQDVGSPDDAVAVHAGMLRPQRRSLDMAKTALILSEATVELVRNLSRNDLVTQDRLSQMDISRIIGNLSSHNNDECVPQPLPCDHTSPYRTYSGWCNNLNFPSYGNAFRAFRRLMRPAYQDGFNEPRERDSNGRALPSARAVSNSVHGTTTKPHVKYTHMLMQFGQFLDHDMTLAPLSTGPDEETLNCSRCDSKETLSMSCFPIELPLDDPHFPVLNGDGSRRCIPFSRSLVGQLHLGYRNQINQLTSFIDASNIYSSTECDANALRLYSMGKLNFTERYDGLTEGLPQGNQEKNCRSLPLHPCFVAGDERNNEHPGLASFHTVWLREHNHIAARLHRINNFWPDEKIFQETRRIVGAIMQNIVYGEFLPKVLGCEITANYDLVLKRTGYYKGYDDSCDPTMSNEFATAAFRFGHTLIRSEFSRMDDFYHNFSTPVILRDVFLDPSALYDREKGGMNTLMLGLIGTPADAFDRFIDKDLRHFLFMKKGEQHSGMDLAALNIQRGRDHGIPPYNQYRELCGMPKARSWSDLSDVMDNDAIDSLRRVYASVADVDLFPGMTSERSVQGGIVGPTGGCILAEQFQRLRRCDRFWFENDVAETRFTPDQLAEIRKVSLAKVICSNMPFIRMIQPRVFDMPDDLLNAQIPCQDIPEIDLYEWLDRQFCVVDHRVINLGKTKKITPCVACTCTSEGPECHSFHVNSCEALLDEFLFAEVIEDTVCVIQCSGMIKQRAGRL